MQTETAIDIKKSANIMSTLIRLPEVKQIVGLSTSTIYKLMAEGSFPKPLHLSLRTRVWVREEIEDYIQTKMLERV